MSDNKSVAILNAYPEAQYNVLNPTVMMEGVPDVLKVAVNVVKINPDPNTGKDVYKERSSGQLALTKVGLNKLAAAANIRVVSTEELPASACIRCFEKDKVLGKRTPCGSCENRHDVKYRVTISIPDPLGGERIVTESKQFICEDEKDKMTSDQYKRWFPHRPAQAESKALLRCLRAAMSIAQNYTPAELQKPFVVTRLAPNFDHPDIKKQYIDKASDSMGLLFGTPNAPRQLAAPAPQELPALPSPPAECATDTTTRGSMGPTNDPPPPPPADDLPFTDDDGLFCADCAVVLTPATRKDGSTMRPREIADFSVARFGRSLCPACQRKAQQDARGGTAA